MKKILLIGLITIIFCFVKSGKVFCQTQKVNELGITGTYLWNKTTIFNVYSGARAKNITGEAFSSGFNLNYSRTIYKNFFARVGVGLFNQRFEIVRPFDFDQTGGALTKILFSTKYYSYSTLNYSGGIGYNWDLKKYKLRLIGLYNLFTTYKQEFRSDASDIFTSTYGHTNPQIRKDKYTFGHSVFMQLAIKRNLGKNFGIELSAVLPLYTKWKKDEIFKEDTNAFYSPDASLGGAFSFIYQFNSK